MNKNAFKFCIRYAFVTHSNTRPYKRFAAAVFYSAAKVRIHAHENTIRQNQSAWYLLECRFLVSIAKKSANGIFERQKRIYNVYFVIIRFIITI